MPSAGPEASGAAGTAGDLAIVLHSHMPYVEGFGTYPFGEEWLFDAVVRSYLPVLEVARDLTLTVTPVLADQLEDAGAAERLRRFLVDYRIGSAEADLRDVDAELRPACAAERDRYRHALELLDAAGGDPLAPFQRAAGEGRVALAASSATHALLPLLATRAGLALQLDAGIRSHRRRFGWDGGFWLPECAYDPGLEWGLARAGVEWFCVDQSAHEEPLAALRPVATEAGPVALPIDWEAISWLWALDGYPSDPAYARSSTANRCAGCGSGGSAAGRTTRRPRRRRRGARRGSSSPRSRRACAATRRSADGAASSPSRSTPSCSATGGRRAPLWLARGAGGRGGGRGAAGDRPEGARRPRAGAAAAAPRQLGRGQGLLDLGLAAGRRPGLGDAAAGAAAARARSAAGCATARAERAARELLAAQASDWAFLDRRGQAGDYAWQRATDHSEALYEAIGCDRVTDPRMRSLAPDMTLAPLLEP